MCCINSLNSPRRESGRTQPPRAGDSLHIIPHRAVSLSILIFRFLRVSGVVRLFNTLFCNSITCHVHFGFVEAGLKPAHVVARGEAGGPQYSCCRGCENGCLLLSLGGLGRRHARLKLGLRPSCCAICKLPLILCLRLLVGQASFLQTCSRRSHAMLVGVLHQARSTGSYHHRSV